ncbi:MAG: hypothetical protein ACRDVM_09850, partial [Acidimicrobiia bacterium]
PDRSRQSGTAAQQPCRDAITALGSSTSLPKWVREEVNRTTPKERREPALRLLAGASEAYAEERFDAAYRLLVEAKGLAPQAATIRELLGLSAYHVDRFGDSLRELRTYRRLAGDTTHMAVEMDCLRALDRPSDVHKAWRLFTELGGSPSAESEARVVYGSFLLDQGKLRDAWQVVRPGRLVADPEPGDVRRWFVAARVAAAGGDMATAGKLRDAARRADPDLPGLSDLDGLIGS